MEFDRVIAFQLDLIPLFGDEICGATCDIKADLYDVFVSADCGEELGVCGDHQE